MQKPTSPTCTFGELTKDMVFVFEVYGIKQRYVKKGPKKAESVSQPGQMYAFKSDDTVTYVG